MNNNFLRQLCYTIEQEYWKRYINDYEAYGDAASTTRKRWEDWQVADDITKQIVSAIQPLKSESQDPWDQLEIAIEKIDEACSILDYIKEEEEPEK